MTTFENTDSQTRVWPDITAPDGTTLELGAGETVDLDLVPNTTAEGEEPNGFVDAFLKPVATPASSPQAPAASVSVPSAPTTSVSVPAAGDAPATQD